MTAGVHRVRGTRRLVGEQEPAVTDHRAGDRHALALPAGQLIGEMVSPLGNAPALPGPSSRSRAPRSITESDGQS